MSSVENKMVTLSEVRPLRSAGWTQSKACPELVERDICRGDATCAEQIPGVACSV